MLNLACLLEDSAANHPARVAVVEGDRALTYAELDDAAARVAGWLVKNGLTPGERVLLACPNLAEFPIIYYGVLKAGGVVVPVNVLLQASELGYHLRDADAAFFFCHEGSAELPLGARGREAFDSAPDCREFLVIGDALEVAGVPIADALSHPAIASRLTQESDTAVVLYTSGTTGQPKGAELTHSNLVLNALASNQLFETVPSNPEKHLVTLPLFHTFGATVQMNAGFAAAATLVMLPRFDPAQALRLLQREEITFFAGVPTMYWGLLNALDAAPDVDVTLIRRHLRRAVAGGASLPLAILEAFADRFGVAILEGYGLSETSPVVAFSHPGRIIKPGSIGQAIWGVEVRLVDAEWGTVEDPEAIGEIAVRGYNVMKGYLGRPDATAEAMKDGWFRTGDLARRDADGYFFIVDRAKDMIIRGGFNVYPREIEETLMRHPAVSLVAVIGVPDLEYGEEIKAVVVRSPRHHVNDDELLTWAKGELAAYKYPRIIEFVDTLPMTSTGKILKRSLT